MHTHQHIECAPVGSAARDNSHRLEVEHRNSGPEGIENPAHSFTPRLPSRGLNTTGEWQPAMWP